MILRLLLMVRDGYPQGMRSGNTRRLEQYIQKFNLTQVDGNLTAVNFSLWDGDSDQDGFLNWHEYRQVLNTHENETPGIDLIGCPLEIR